MQFFGKNWLNNRLATPLVGAPPQSEKSWIRHCSDNSVTYSMFYWCPTVNYTFSVAFLISEKQRKKWLHHRHHYHQNWRWFLLMIATHYLQVSLALHTGRYSFYDETLHQTFFSCDRQEYCQKGKDESWWQTDLFSLSLKFHFALKQWK